MAVRAVLFDLDETLIPEEASVEESFLAACKVAEEKYGLHPKVLAQSVRAHAKRLWHLYPTAPECMALGISSWEGLHARFEGDSPLLYQLRELAPEYRRQVWRKALAEHGVHNDALAQELAERFPQERAKRYEPFPDAVAVLHELQPRYRLALVTNGPPCLQREKLSHSGLERFFEVVVISGELGVGKPQPPIFERALAALGTLPERSVMVGDSFERDVRGAKRAGLRAVWLQRAAPMDAPLPSPSSASAAAELVEPDATIRELGELPDALARL